MTTKKITASILCSFLVLPVGNSLAISTRNKAVGIPAVIAATTAVWYYKDVLIKKISENSEQLSILALGVAGICSVIKLSKKKTHIDPSTYRPHQN